ncbi:MAG: translocation/assembly module TamB domain-containing protein [Syntrophobacterales bacterium]|nr:translocation/assembly module TamB domain-containing protein [Syntrophobacterales bacterium]
MGNAILRTCYVLLILLSLLLVLLLIQPEPFQRYIANYIASYVARETNLNCVFSGVRWRPLSGILVRNLAIYSDRRQVFSAQGVDLSYRLSWKKPFIIPVKLTIDKPLIVGELDRGGKITNFPLISGGTKIGKGNSPFNNVPNPDIEVKNGRIIAIRDGHIIVSLREVSANIEVSVILEEDESNIFHIRVNNGSLFMEKPLVEALNWNGVITVSKDGVSLRRVSVFSDHWGVFTGTGFWGEREERGFFRFSMEGLRASTLPEFPLILRKYLGSTSLKGEITVSSSSVEINYSAVDSKIGRMEGKIFISFNSQESPLVTVRSFLKVGLFLDGKSVAYLRLQGVVDGALQFDTGGKVLSSGGLSLDYLELSLESGRSVVVDRGIIRWRLDDKNFELEKVFFDGAQGRLNARADLQWKRGLEVLLEWDIDKDKSFYDGSLRYGSGLWDKVIRKVLSIPIKRSSGIISAYCSDRFCNNVKAMKVSGHVTLSSQETFILLEGTAPSLSELRLTLLSKTSRFSEWSQFLGIPFDVEGMFKAKGSLSGSNKGLRFNIKSSLEDARFGGVMLRRLSIESDGWIRPYDSDGKSVGKGYPVLRIGDVAYSLEQRVLLLFENIRRVGDSRKLNATISAGQFDKDLSVTINIEGLNGMPSGTFNASVSNLWDRPLFSVTRSTLIVPSLGKIDIALGGMFSDDEGLEIQRIKINQGSQSITGSLKIGTSRQLEGRIRLEDISLAKTVFESQKLKLKGGEIDGEVVIRGFMKDPFLAVSIKADPGEFSWESGKSGILKWDRFEVTAQLGHGYLTGNLVMESPNMKKPLEAKVMLPIKFSLTPLELGVYRDRPLSGAISITDFDLGHVVPLFVNVGGVRGNLNANVRFSGTLTNLKSDGEGVITEGELEIRRNYVVSNIEGLLKFEHSGIRISGIRAKVFGGEVLIDGFMPYENWKEINVLGRFQHITLPEFYGITGRGNGQATLKIAEGHPFIEGSFKAEEATMNLGLLRDSIKKNIDVVTDYVGDRASPRVKRFSMDFGLKFFIDLTEAKAKVVGFGLNDEVSGKLWLVKQIGEKIRLEGKIEHLRGWYQFNEAKIEISEGYALFKGDPDPDLFLVGVKKVRDIEITLHLLGKGSEPQLLMSSDPPLDKVDIVSYLIFNRPATTLTGREGLALQTQVAAFIGSQTSRILKKAIGDTPFTPDVIQMRESDSGQSSVIEIGKYITPDFYVTYEKDLRSGGSDSVKMEYRLNRHFSIQTQIGNQNGADLFWRYDFGK